MLLKPGGEEDKIGPGYHPNCVAALPSVPEL